MINVKKNGQKAMPEPKQQVAQHTWAYSTVAMKHKLTGRKRLLCCKTEEIKALASVMEGVGYRRVGHFREEK
jgi:hypothetical protein